MNLQSPIYKFKGQNILPQSCVKEKALLYISPIDNKSIEPGLESYFLKALRYNFSDLDGVELVGLKASTYRIDIQLEKFSRKSSPTLIVGTAASEASGGLMKNQVSSAFTNVKIKYTARLLNRCNLNSLFSEVYKVNGEVPFEYENILRFSYKSGATSAVHKNLSREEIILDKAVSDFALKIINQLDGKYYL